MIYIHHLYFLNIILVRKKETNKINENMLNTRTDLLEVISL